MKIQPRRSELFNGTGGTPGGSNGVVGPYGLGVRVPLLVVSPWNAGGWVDSETLDHTSLIRFVEARFGASEPNITPWRRAVCGDLTSAFDFKRTSDDLPALPSVVAYKPDQSATPPSYHPVTPRLGRSRPRNPSLHERGLADRDLVADHEREHFAGTSAVEARADQTYADDEVVADRNGNGDGPAVGGDTNAAELERERERTT